MKGSAITATVDPPPAERRPDSIDLLLGVAMILISLDHVRDYFTYPRFSPEAITHAWLALFITRRLTHFCAPLFFLLAGLAALSSVSGLTTVSSERHSMALDTRTNASRVAASARRGFTRRSM